VTRTRDQRLVRVERVRPVQTPVVPDERDMTWWLEEIEPTAAGLYRAAPPPLDVPETPAQREVLRRAAEAVAVNAGHERAPNTLRAYQHEWRTFVRWCVAGGQRCMPASARAVQAYIADVAAHARPRTVRGRRGDEPLQPLPPRRPGGLDVALAAVAWYHRLYRHPNPCDDALVQDELARIRRRAGTAPVRKHPLTVAHLEQIVTVLEAERRNPSGKTPLERKAAARRAVRDRAIILLGFAGAFRRGELAALGLDDVAFRPEGLDAALAQSKTDQEGEGFIKAILRGERSTTCPRRALEDWYAELGTTRGPIFREIDRFNRLVLNREPLGHRAGLSGDAVALVVKERVRQIGLNPRLYSGHSLRAGFITAAAEAGRSAHEIMAMTGHKDPAIVYVYIRVARRFGSDNPGRGLL
jgi:integrase